MSTTAPTVLSYSDLIGRPIDNTALAAFMECQRKYAFSMVLHRRRKTKMSPALAYGSSWHHALEAHYKGEDRAGVHAAVLTRWEQPDAEGDYRTVQRVLLEYDNYVKQYGSPADEAARGSGKTVGEGDTALVEIPVELNIPGLRHPYTGKIDRVFEKNGLYYVEDHKTTSRFDKYYFKQFTLSNQMKGYAVLAQILTGKPIAGVRINAHICHKSDSLFERDTITFSQEILDEWRTNTDNWMAMIENSVAEEARLSNADMSSFESIQQAYPANFNACAGKYGMCQYSEICSLGMRVRQKAIEADFDVYPWNPLEVDGEDAS